MGGFCGILYGNVHVLLTSRHENDIESAVEGLDLRKKVISMNTAEINKDITQYVSESLKKYPFKTWPRDLKSEVTKTLTCKADGVFRWAALQVLELRFFGQNVLDVEKVIAALKNLPADLEKTYERMLMRIEKSPYSDIAMTIIRWLTLSIRPLRLREVLELRGFETAADENHRIRFNVEKRLQSISAICQMLSGLIEISNSNPLPLAEVVFVLMLEPRSFDYEAVEGNRTGILYETVSFSHFTVQEYLRGENVFPKRYSLNFSLGHQFILQSCLEYINNYELYKEATQSSQPQKILFEDLNSAAEPDLDWKSDFNVSDSGAANSDSASSGVVSSDAPVSKRTDQNPFPLLLYAASYWWRHAIVILRSSRDKKSISNTFDQIAALTSNLEGLVFTLSVRLALAHLKLFMDERPQLIRNARGMGKSLDIKFTDPQHRHMVSLLINCLTAHLVKNGESTYDLQISIRISFDG